MPVQTGIPKLIHQSWNDMEVPPEWTVWVDSWRHHHPDWEYRLWTGEDVRAFLQQHYPWFLPIYDGYSDPVMRADVVRYFLLDHFGGIYVDLHFECLRFVDDLLAGRELVVGFEPDAHARLPLTRRRGFDRVVGHGFIASRPGHPFWTHAHRELVRSHKCSGSWDATGSFFLTRAIASAPEPDLITMLDADVLYPVASPYAVQAFGPQEADLEQAYAAPHWSESWACDDSWRPRNSAGRRFGFSACQEGQMFANGLFDLDSQRRLWAAGASAPLVSCLMVTKATDDRLPMAKRAIRCFLAQTYPNLELVLLPDGTSDALEHYVHNLGDPRIRYHRIPTGGRPLGDLLNVTVDLADGCYVCLWDDDDLYDPERVELQMATLLALAGDACFLARERLWWPARRKLALSRVRAHENTMVCAKDQLPRYPPLNRGEDVVVVEQLARTCRIVLVDAPDLYTYVYHGNNTCEQAHFESIFSAATDTLDGGSAYTEQVLAMATRLPIEPEDLLHAGTDLDPAVLPEQGPRISMVSR